MHNAETPVLHAGGTSATFPMHPNYTHTIMAKGNNAHKKEVKKPKKEKPKPLPASRKTHG